jgi:transposase-like protein
MEVEKSTLGSMKEVAKKSQTYDQLINQRITCNAAGCQEKGSIEIHVKAGKFGTVTLFVCPNCVSKFTE